MAELASKATRSKDERQLVCEREHMVLLVLQGAKDSCAQLCPDLDLTQWHDNTAERHSLTDRSR